MATRPNDSPKFPSLRRQEEGLLQASERDLAAMPVKDMQQLVHELQVHQIELETQNEELRRTERELQTARNRYADLYDLSPAGHLTLDTNGKIVEANSRARGLLNAQPRDVIGE